MNREAFIEITGKTPELAYGEITLEIRANCMPQVDALMAAGWRFELPEVVNRKDGETRMETEPWQWYWRSPPKRKGSKGQKYWSTQMAFNALQRQLKQPPK